MHIFFLFIFNPFNSLFSFKTLSEATSIGRQRFRSSILNSKVSKQIHDQQETSLCWAYALATMLRSSLRVFLKSRMPLGIAALKIVDSNCFHKRLRREIIMMPIPKPLIINYKMIDHPNQEDFEDEIIEKQLHHLKLAVLRVSSTLISFYLLSQVFIPDTIFESNWNFIIKLTYPSSIDPPGICLLKSIQDIFCKVGLSENRPTFQIHEINTVEKLKTHLMKVPTCICPVIIAYQFSNHIAHAMVATGIRPNRINNKQEDFVQCKNSYRDDTSQPGQDCQSIHLHCHLIFL